MRSFIATGVTAAALLASMPAPALAVNCSVLPNPVYLQIGDTQEPVIKALGKALRDSAVNPMTVVYATSGSCTNVEAMYSGVKITTNPFYIPSSAEDPSWTPATASPSCTIDPAGHDVDLANSALFVSACNPNAPPAGVALFQGPIQAYVMVVPAGSSQVAITAEEAYFVFGFGAQGQAEPWTDETQLFIRTPTKSTLLAWAANVGVPAVKWKGVPKDKSSEVLSLVANSTNPERTLGILGAEIYDGNRSALRSLAYQTYHQSYAYYPDSTSTSFDKRNLRDGHYVVWSPTVWLTHVDGQNVPLDPRVGYIIDLLLNQPATPTPDFQPLDLIISKGLVPDCAMQVTRTHEGGDLSPYQPARPCGCYYENRVGAAPASCVSCTDDTPCGAGKCRLGFCEAR